MVVVGLLVGCGGAGTSVGIVTPPTQPVTPALEHILFVGDSFTHGRYSPVRNYDSGGVQGATAGSALVFDENYGQTGARAESSAEPGPDGGIPGIFAELAVEAGLNDDVHIEAISSTSLQNNYAAAASVIAQAKWSAVVLQEISTRPLTVALSGDSTSDPANFCASVGTIEAGIHTADTAASASPAKIYLYETWARADEAAALSGPTSSPPFAANFAANITTLTNFYHNVYNRAATLDGKVTAVAPVGEAWARAYAEGAANEDPYVGTSALPSLWYGLNTVNNPVITSPDYLHPSIYGAYLAGLVLFEQITGVNSTTLGSGEKAAAALGISSAQATALQTIAHESVLNESATPINQTVDPCTLTM
jgi:hypothetical protein